MIETPPTVEPLVTPSTPELFAVPSAALTLSEKISEKMKNRFIHTENYGINAGVYNRSSQNTPS